MTASEAGSDRRRAARIRVSVSVEIRDQHGFSLHSVSDLSQGGAFFDRSIPNPVGSTVKVTLHLPGEPPLTCDGEVVNVPDRKNFGMGLRFFNMSEADQARLTAFTDGLAGAKND
ncbi:MAG TPA: PilZ domain-containing protein [Myxococcales bacterium]|nr:PilZ domain-containing protein [Myxococcales bacterium]